MTEKTITPENAEIIMIEQFTFWSEIIPLEGSLSYRSGDKDAFSRVYYSDN